MDEGMRTDGVDGGDSIEERRRAFERANMGCVAVVAAERSVDKAFELLPPTSIKTPFHLLLPVVGPELDNPLQRPPSYFETFLVRSIEAVDRLARQHMPRHWNRLVSFYAYSSLKLAQSVLDMLPAELTGISKPEERATEYLQCSDLRTGHPHQLSYHIFCHEHEYRHLLSPRQKVVKLSAHLPHKLSHLPAPPPDESPAPS
ncbi:hypothetical protein F5887DRAFT_1286797 [Amanita rubescens]|nr:hypothetical protein F5887DRAFT_1286797 [Amanita rubescens]